MPSLCIQDNSLQGQEFMNENHKMRLEGGPNFPVASSPSWT